VEALEGSHGTVLEEVDADRGMIKIDGELWQARSFDGNEKYLPGERVRVLRVRGATAHRVARRSAQHVKRGTMES
jgi:membrane protein implicated in regulation of membrane protease activity